jgi:homoserine O-acetyltransferase
LLTSASLPLAAAPLYAAEPAKPVEGSWVAPRFQFHTGQTLENLRLHYVTLGERSNPAVLVLHGTYQSAGAMLSKATSRQLWSRPAADAQGTSSSFRTASAGKSTKPPTAQRGFRNTTMTTWYWQYRMLTNEGMGWHLRLIIGNSMGGMQTWIWGGTYPGFADA